MKLFTVSCIIGALNPAPAICFSKNEPPAPRSFSLSATAKAAGIRVFKNGGFLDGTPDEASIRARFAQFVKTTQKKKYMIVICHFRPSTVLFLEKLNKEYAELPVRLVTLPEMAELLADPKSGEE